MASLTNKVEVFTVPNTVAGNPESVKVPRKKKSFFTWSYFKEWMNNKKRCKQPDVKLFNRNVDDSKLIDGFYGLLALLILIVSPFSITLLPVNNSLAYPEYWYEIIFSKTLLGLYLAIAGTLESQAVFNGFFNLRSLSD